MGVLTQEQKTELWKFFNFTGDSCYYCGREVKHYPSVQGKNAPQDQKTRDHLIPLSRGGSNAVDNLVIACIGCNGEKSNLTLQEFRVVWAFRKNAVKVKPIRIFSGEIFTPPPTFTQQFTAVFSVAATLLLIYISKIRF